MMMKRVLLVIAMAVLLMTGGVPAQEDLVNQLLEACEADVENYCSQVTLGEGRLLACFYAHQDKLSSRCEYALYDTAAQLEQFAAAVTHVARECRDDMIEHCGEVEMGEGRVGACLLEHKSELQDNCRQAIDDVGLEVVED